MVHYNYVELLKAPNHFPGHWERDPASKRGGGHGRGREMRHRQSSSPGPGVDTARSSAARPREVRNQGIARSRYSGLRSWATRAEA